MASIFDYLEWRGDLSFSENKLTEIDNIIFNMLVYLNLDCINNKNQDKNKAVNLKIASELFFSDPSNNDRKIGLIIPTKKIFKLFVESVKYKRFAEVIYSDYVNDVNIEGEYQFCAVTFHLPGDCLFISFRGTDDSIVGWHEDFNLSYLEKVPSQQKAAEYVNKISESYPGKSLYIGGHSKGGNLAVYAAVHCNYDTQKKIIHVFNNDGPGFSKEMIESDNFKNISDRIDTFVPQSSFFGTMFEHGEIKIVKSKQHGIFQHDGFSWELKGPEFIKLSKLSEHGLKNEAQFRAGMENMSLDERKKFVSMFFEIIEKTGATSLEDLNESKLKSISVILKTINGLDKSQREMMQTLLLKLFDLKNGK